MTVLGGLFAPAPSWAGEPAGAGSSGSSPSAGVGVAVGPQRQQADVNFGRINLAPKMADRLRREGIKTGAVGGAQKTRSQGVPSFRFPQAIDEKDDKQWSYTGGIELYESGRDLKLTKLTVKGESARVLGVVNHRSRRLFDLKRSTKPKLGQMALVLNQRSATMVNKKFHTSKFRSGQTFGYFSPAELFGASVEQDIHISNDSRYYLHFVSADTNGFGEVTSATPDIGPGGKANIQYSSNNSEGGDIKLTYRIDGSEHTISGQFQVPIIGVNVSACADDSYVQFTQCTTPHGWHVTQEWDIVTNIEKGPFFKPGFSGEEYKFTKVGSNLVLGNTNPNLPDDGAVVKIYGDAFKPVQRWRWTPDAVHPEWSQLRNSDTGTCLEVNGDGEVDLGQCAQNTDGMLWKPVENPAGGSSWQNKSTQTYLGLTEDINRGTAWANVKMIDELNARSSWGAASTN